MQKRGPSALPLYGNLPAHKRPKRYTLLHYWLKENSVARTSFARQVGCNACMVNYWADGRCVPSLPYAFMIEKITEGAVSAATWLGTEVGKAIWNDIQKKASPS
jgi:hypothetical protein